MTTRRQAYWRQARKRPLILWWSFWYWLAGDDESGTDSLPFRLVFTWRWWPLAVAFGAGLLLGRLL